MRHWFACIAVVSSIIFGGCREAVPEASPQLVASVLTVAIHRDPQTFNPLMVTDTVSDMVSEQLHAPLMRLNQETQKMEPALAESWQFDESGRQLLVKLRSGLCFSDGVPLTADDVVFTFRALLDPSVASPLSESARVEGEPMRVERVDSRTLRFHIPKRTAVIERVFDSIGILPRHRLQSSLADESFAAAYGPGAEPGAVVGLGPFVLESYRPGQRVILKRNPHYWRRALEKTPFPRLDGIVFEIVSDPSARLLRFQAGEFDLVTSLAPEAYHALREAESSEVRLIDVGPGISSERLWFNLNPDSPIDLAKKKWFSDVRFRRAVSLAIDRAAMARVVWSELASPAKGPVSPANQRWVHASLAIPGPDLEAAKSLLEKAGFSRDESGWLHGPEGEPVVIDLVTNHDNSQRVRTASFLEQDLSRLGIQLRPVPIEGGQLFARVTGSFDYEACLLGITQTDPDPSAEMAIWPSRAPLHLWHPAQKQPATDWEARLDSLMERQLTTLDPERRKLLYDEVQEVIAAQLPVLDLVIPHVLIGSHRRVSHLKPTPFSHPVWNSDELYVAPRVESLVFLFP